MEFNEIFTRIGLNKITANGKYRISNPNTCNLEARAFKNRIQDEMDAWIGTDLEIELFKAAAQYIQSSASKYSASVLSEKDGDLKNQVAELVLYQDAVDGKYKLYDSKEHKISSFHVEVYYRLNSISKNKIPSETPIAVTGFYPKHLESKFEGVLDGKEVVYFNEFSAPAWRSLEPSSKPIEQNILYRTYKHVLPTPEEFEFSLDMLYHTGNGNKPETFQAIIGTKGCGKNKLFDISSCYVGKKYSRNTQKKNLEGFNGFLHNSLVVLFDEFSIRDEDTLNALKRISNSRVSVELKHVDAKDVDVYALMFLFSNSTSGFGIEMDERRFSMLKPTTTPLKKVLTDTELDYLTAILDQDDDNPSQDVVDFCHWVISSRESKSKINARTDVYKSEFFYTVVEEGYYGWKGFIREFIIENIDKTESQNPPKYTSAKEKFNKMPEYSKKTFPRAEKINDFLASSPFYGQEIMATIGKGIRGEKADEKSSMKVNENYIFINPEFAKLYKKKEKLLEELKQVSVLDALEEIDL